MGKVYKAFLSSTCRDLQEYRNEIAKNINADPDWKCVWKEGFATSSRPPLEKCLDEVRGCDLLVGIIGNRYGNCPPGDETSYTEHEYREAVRCNLHPHMFVGPDDFAPVHDRGEDADKQQKLQKFRVLIDRQHTRGTQDFSSPGALASDVVTAIKQWQIEQLTLAVDYDATRLPDTEEAPSAAKSVTSSLPAKIVVRQPPVAPHVAQVMSLRALGRKNPDVFGTAFAGLSAVVGSPRDAFWFLRFVNSGEWLLAIAPTLRRALAERPDELVWSVGRMLVGVGDQDPEAVVASGLLPVLWSGGTGNHLHWAMQAIEAGDLWQHGTVVALLSEAHTAWPDDLADVAFRLAEYGKQSPARAEFALTWIAEWLKVTPPQDRDSMAHGMSLSYALADIAEAQPDAVVEAAMQLIEGAVAGSDPDEVAFHLQYRFATDMSHQAPVLQIRSVLADKLENEDQRPKVLSVLAQLLASDDAAKRVLALVVMKQNPVGLKDLVVGAARDPRNHDRQLLSRWMHMRIRQTYADLSEADKHAVTEALLALPDEATDESMKGFIKLHALAAIPEELRSDGVRKAIAALYERYPDLPNPPHEPHEPGGGVRGGAYTPGDKVEIDLISPSDNPLGAIDQQVAAWEGPENGEREGLSSPAVYALERRLEQSPESIEPLANALAERLDDLDNQLTAALATSIASAVRRSKGLSGQIVYEIAQTLREALTSRARQDLSDALAERWEQVSEADRVAVAELLAEWVRDEPRPDEGETARDLDNHETDRADNVGLNTPRGGIAVSLIDLAAAMREDAPKAALDAIMTVADDPSPFVRAIVARWVSKLWSEKRRGWVIEVVQRCISDFSPYVLPSIPQVFGGLEPKQIQDFGANVVRIMLASSEEAAKGAGFLAALWSLRHPSAETAAIADEVLSSESTAARGEAAHVFAHNILNDDDVTQCECERRCQAIIEEQPREVREALIQHLPEAPDEPSAVTELLRTAAQVHEVGPYSVLDSLLYRHANREEKLNPPVVKAIVAGLMDNPSEETVRQFLRTSGHMLPSICKVLRDNDEKKLALRLLDAACYHCVPMSDELLDTAEKLMKEMVKTPEGD